MLVMVTSTSLFIPGDHVICYTCAEVQVVVDDVQLALKLSHATVKPNSILVNLNLLIGVLKVVQNQLAPSSLVC